MKLTTEEINKIIEEEITAVLSEEDDRCTRIAKRKYDVWPSAYASGALVKCRNVGAKNWGNSKKESLHEEEGVDPNDLRDILDDEGGAAGLEPMVKGTKSTEEEVKDTLEDMDDVGKHEKGDYIKDDGKQIRVKK